MDDIETRIVQMRFENEQFESGVAQTMNSLSNLNESLKMKNASDGINAVAKDSTKLVDSMGAVNSAVEKVKMGFDTLEIIGITTLMRLTNAAITAGVQMTNALLQPIIQGGQRRALNIEAAKFQLEGLGVAWDSIKDDINYGVKDTAYGLDAAAKVASQLVASNVQVGDDMKSSLRAISGVAAMTNSQYEEIGHIFTTVASNGRLMTMQLRELSNRGLNASATLAKALNKTEAEINDMVSKGKIDFKTFADAMDDAFGSHAKEANKTFTGAMSNVNAALSRIGAKFADPVFENLKNIFNAMIPAIDNVNNALTPVVDSFELVSRYLGDNLGLLLKNEDFVMGLMNLVVDFYSYLKPIGIAILEVTGLRPDIEGIAKSFRSFAEGMQLYGDNAMKVKDIWKGIFQFLIDGYHTIKAIATALSPLFKLAYTGLMNIMSIMSSLSKLFVYLSPYLNAFITQLANYINTKLADAIINLGNFLVLIVYSIGYFVTALQNNLAILSNTAGPFFNSVYNVCNFTVGLLSDLYDAFSKLDLKVIGSIIGIITAIAATFLAVRKIVRVYNTVNNFLNSVLSLGSVFTNIANIFKDVHLMLVSVRKQINVKTFADVMQNIALLFLSIAVSLKILSTIDWESMTGAKGYLIGAIAAVLAIYGTIIVAVELLMKKSSGIEGILKNGQLLGALGMLSATMVQMSILFISIASSFKILSTIDWASMEKSKPFLLGAITTVISILGLITVASVFSEKSKPSTINVLRKSITSIGILFLEMGAAFKLLSTVNWEKLTGSMAYLTLFAKTTINLMIILSVVMLASRKVKASALKQLRKTIIDIGILYIEIGAAFKIMSDINWASFEGSVPYIIGSLISMSIIFGKLVEVSKKSKKIKKAILDRLRETILDIGLLFLSISASFKIMSDINWESFEAARPYLIGTLLSSILLFNAISTAAKASIILKGSVVNALRNTLTSIGLLFIEIAATFKILETVDWSKMSGSLGYILAAFGSVILIFGAIAALSVKQNNLSPVIIFSLSNTLSSIGFLFIELAASFKILSSVNWSSLDGSIGYLLAALGSVILIFGSIAALSARENQINPRVVNSLRKTLGSIGFLFIELAMAFEILDSVNWTNLSGSIGYLLAALGSVILIFGTIAALSVSSNRVNPRVVNSLRKTLGSIGFLFIELAMAFEILDSVNWERMDGSTGYLLVAVGSVILIFGAIAALAVKSNNVNIRAVNALRKTLGSIGFLFIELAATFALLSFIDWSSFDGSAGYLIGAVAVVTGLLTLLVVLNKVTDSTSILVSALSTLGMISVLFISLALTFDMLGNVNWDALEKAKGYLIGTVIVLGVMSGVVIALAALGPEASGIAALAVAALSGLFLSLGMMFEMIGVASNMIGDGIQKIADAFNTLLNIEWGKATEVVKGLGVLAVGLVASTANLKLIDIGGALAFATISTLVGFAIRQLAGIDPAAVDQVSNSIVQFFTNITEALSGREDVIELITRFASALPIVASSISAALIQFAVGGLGLVAFAGELIIFSTLINLAGQGIGPAFDILVQGIMQAGMAISGNVGILLASIGELMAFGVLISAAGALLIVGGGLMSAGAGLILLSGTLLATGMESLVYAIMDSGKLISDNVASLMISLTILSAFSMGLIPVGIALIVGGGTFTIGAGLMAAGAALFLSAATSFSASGIILSNAAVEITDTFDDIIDNISSALDSLEGLAVNFEDAGANIISGLINGIENGLGAIEDSSIGMASAVLSPFCDYLGIHSPAWEFIKAAGNVIAGFVQGISDGTPDVENSMQGLAQAAEDNFGVDLTSQGGFSIESFTDAITDGFQEVLPQIMNMFGLGGTGVGNSWGDGLVNGVDEGIRDMAAHLSAAQQSILSNMASAGANDAAIQAAQRGMTDNNYIELRRNYASWNDKIDVGEYFKPANYSSGGGSGVGGTSASALASTISGTSGTGSGINDASKGAVSGSGNTITNSNNTYNNTFVQNNYSPEALSRSEIYTQTRAQLDSFYGFMREKNPAF